MWLRWVVTKTFRWYESLLLKLSQVKDSKIYGVKLLMVAVKVGGIAFLYGKDLEKDDMATNF